MNHITAIIQTRIDKIISQYSYVNSQNSKSKKEGLFELESYFGNYDSSNGKFNKNNSSTKNSVESATFEIRLMDGLESIENILQCLVQQLSRAHEKNAELIFENRELVEANKSLGQMFATQKQSNSTQVKNASIFETHQEHANEMNANRNCARTQELNQFELAFENRITPLADCFKSKSDDQSADQCQYNLISSSPGNNEKFDFDFKLKPFFLDSEDARNYDEKPAMGQSPQPSLYASCNRMPHKHNQGANESSIKENDAIQECVTIENRPSTNYQSKAILPVNTGIVTDLNLKAESLKEFHSQDNCGHFDVKSSSEKELFQSNDTVDRKWFTNSSHKKAANGFGRGGGCQNIVPSLIKEEECTIPSFTHEEEAQNFNKRREAGSTVIYNMDHSQERAEVDARKIEFPTGSSSEPPQHKVIILKHQSTQTEPEQGMVESRIDQVQAPQKEDKTEIKNLLTRIKQSTISTGLGLSRVSFDPEHKPESENNPESPKSVAPIEVKCFKLNLSKISAVTTEPKPDSNSERYLSGAQEVFKTNSIEYKSSTREYKESETSSGRSSRDITRYQRKKSKAKVGQQSRDPIQICDEYSLNMKQYPIDKKKLSEPKQPLITPPASHRDRFEEFGMAEYYTLGMTTTPQFQANDQLNSEHKTSLIMDDSESSMIELNNLMITLGATKIACLQSIEWTIMTQMPSIASSSESYLVCNMQDILITMLKKTASDLKMSILTEESKMKLKINGAVQEMLAFLRESSTKLEIARDSYKNSIERIQELAS